jgi:hypothetical protein
MSMLSPRREASGLSETSGSLEPQPARSSANAKTAAYPKQTRMAILTMNDLMGELTGALSPEQL